MIGTILEHHFSSNQIFFPPKKVQLSSAPENKIGRNFLKLEKEEAKTSWPFVGREWGKFHPQYTKQ